MSYSSLLINLLFLSAYFKDGSPNHAPIAPVSIDTRVIELELEKRRLTTELLSAVSEEEYLALKETLEDTKEAHSSYKVCLMPSFSLECRYVSEPRGSEN